MARCAPVLARQKHARRRGVAAVELALVTPFLVFLLLGLAEFSLIVSDHFVLTAAARAGVRLAAVGAPTSQITAKIQEVTADLDQSRLAITLEYRVQENGLWGAWQPLGDTTEDGQAVNNAPRGAEVRVGLEYQHELLMPGLFGAWADDPDAGTKTLRARAAMRRE